MFRSVLPLFLLAVLAFRPLLQAQSSNLSPIPPGPLVEDKMYAKSYANYDALRQGAKIEVAVVSFHYHHDPKLGSLPVFLRSAPSLAPEPISTRLEFDPIEGLSLSNLQPHSKTRIFPFSSGPVEVLVPAYKNRPVAFRFKVAASPSAKPGAYVLRGNLTYREVDNYGISEPQVLPIEISLRVVERNARVNKDRYWAFDQSQAEETTALILAAPLLIPAAAVAGAVCLVTLGHCTD